MSWEQKPPKHADWMKRYPGDPEVTGTPWAAWEKAVAEDQDLSTVEVCELLPQRSYGAIKGYRSRYFKRLRGGQS